MLLSLMTVATAQPPPLPERNPHTYPLAWGTVGSALEMSGHTAMREPDQVMGVGSAVRLNLRGGLGRRVSAVLGVSGGYTIMVRGDPRVDSGRNALGLIGEAGARWAVDPDWSLDLLGGVTFGGGADWGPVASLGVQRALGRGDWLLGVRLRLPTALLYGEEFFDDRCPGCVEPAIYRHAPGTMGLTLELATRASSRTER